MKRRGLASDVRKDLLVVYSDEVHPESNAIVGAFFKLSARTVHFVRK